MGVGIGAVGIGAVDVGIGAVGIGAVDVGIGAVDVVVGVAVTGV